MENYPLSQKVVSVILEYALGKQLDYLVPPQLEDQIAPGVQVEVPLRGKVAKGYVLQVKNQSNHPCKPINSVFSEGPKIPQDLFALSLFMSDYYLTPLDRVLKIVLPSSIRNQTKGKEQLFISRNKTKEEIKEHLIKIREKNPEQGAILEEMLLVTKGFFLTELLEKCKTSRGKINTLCKQGWLRSEPLRFDRSPLKDMPYFQAEPKKLNEEQQKALDLIEKTREKGIFETHLIFGVTGSGKTEIYLRAIENTLKQGKGAIMLVPEVSLTDQTIERFKARFQEQIAIQHYRLSDGERLDEWEHIYEGRAKIVIGARSAIFSPVKNLGLLIVDEEHEASYKSEETPSYSARDLAVWRGQYAKCPVILGSATPSLESYQNALNGKYILSCLKERATKSPLPPVKIIDMGKEYEKKGFTLFSEALLNGIEMRMKKGEQTILFLNRRGYHSMLFCKTCEEPLSCPHCSRTLTFHFNEKLLCCHLCNYQIPLHRECPKCHSPNPLIFKGVGTEQVERSLHAIFKEIKTIRLDADTTKHKGSHQKLLRDFGSGKADVLIGTQMIAKGLHFSEVTLVGVLNSDSALNIPDFRSSEVVFQLITQVAGRAGRGDLPGEVIIQTCMPKNETITCAATQNFEKFFDSEKIVREHFSFPPFVKLAKLLFFGENEQKVRETALNFRKQIEMTGEKLTLFPVIPSGVLKIKDQFRYQFLVSCKTQNPLIKGIKSTKEKFSLPSGIKLFIDINPLSTY